MKELLSKSYFLVSGLASLTLHSFLLSLLLWNLLLHVIRLHHKCLWINQEIVTEDLGTGRNQGSSLPSFPHSSCAQALFSLSILLILLPPGGKLAAFHLPSMSQILYLSEPAKEGTLAWSQKPELICHLFIQQIFLSVFYVSGIGLSLGKQ